MLLSERSHSATATALQALGVEEAAYNPTKAHHDCWPFDKRLGSLRFLMSSAELSKMMCRLLCSYSKTLALVVEAPGAHLTGALNLPRLKLALADCAPGQAREERFDLLAPDLKKREIRAVLF